MNLMLLATVSVAVTNIILVILYLVNIRASSKTINDLINKLLARDYIEYSNVELAKDREETRRKKKEVPNNKKDFVRL